MKLSLKNKLIAGFILILLLLSSSLLVAYKITTYTMASNEEVFKFNEARVLINPIMDMIENNYGSIGKNDEFDETIISELVKIKSKLKIIDTDGLLIFDSENQGASKRKEKVEIKTLVHFDASFEADNPKLIRFSFPVINDGKQLANAVFVVPKVLVTNEKTENKAIYVLIPIIIGFACSILIMLVFVIKVSQGVLGPLNALNKSARQIAGGNLDFNIKYDKNNELGAFTKAFDMMKEELKDSLQRQREYEEARKELIASISHDLKTPVASIKAYVEGLQDGIAKDKTTTERYLAVIKNKTDSLTKLIEDLFQHSLRDLGKFRMNIEEQYSGKVLRKIIEPLKVQFENSNVQFIVEEPIPDILVNIDSSRIEQVLVNLIQNAKKYTPEGGSIRFRAALEDEHLMISVKDTGYGVSPEELPHIFEKFYRGEKFKTRDFEGAGLGLSICKYIVEQHGGEIIVESKLNEGSTFTFTIPKV